MLSGLLKALQGRVAVEDRLPFMAEFRAEFGIKGAVECTELRKRTDQNGLRSVYRLSADAQTFVVKLTEGGASDVFRAEYEMGARLFEHFQNVVGLSVPKPLFFSEKQSFFVSEFIKGSTTDRVIQGSQDQDKTDRVFTQAGRWLAHLHGMEAVTETEFWPRFRLQEIKARLEKGVQGHKADPSKAQVYLKRLRDKARQVKGRGGFDVFSHGDFWSSNLIVTPDMACGLDFAYARRRPLSSDFSEFLMVDLLLPCDGTDLDPSGITGRHLELFLGGYGAEQDREVLNFILQCKLVLEWLRFTEVAYDKRQGVRKRFHEAERRLDQVLYD